MRKNALLSIRLEFPGEIQKSSPVHPPKIGGGLVGEQRRGRGNRIQRPRIYLRLHFFRRKCLPNDGGVRLHCSTGMTIQVAVICDAATDYNGKLNLLGTFDTIYAPQLPVHHPQCSVATRIAFDRMEEGPHHLSIHFVDEDGHGIMSSTEVPMEVTFPSDATFISRNFIVNIQQLEFSKVGLYSVLLVMDERQLCSIPLAVKHMKDKVG